MRLGLVCLEVARSGVAVAVVVVLVVLVAVTVTESRGFDEDHRARRS